jgi:hypothetical protein
VQRDPNPWRANKTEAFGPLFCHHDPVSATNEIGVKESSACNKAWMLNRRSTYALQRCGEIRGESSRFWVCPAACPFGRNMEWDGVRWNRAAIHPPRRGVQIGAE